MASGFLLWISSLALILFLFSAAVASLPASPFLPSGQVPDARIAGVREELGNGEKPEIAPAVVRAVNSERAREWTVNEGNMPASEEFVFRRLVDVQRVQEEGGVANHIAYTIAVVGGTLDVVVHRLDATIDGLNWNYVDSTA
ncbi:hypothetical protein AXF42_Ash017830 [Apostasia shenzhenica]|uniref:Cysteine proteinase inhibitor n=1 Tax=Apostasia shenzhenica TaxID=1088818 RepID=A0A2I0A3X7_9ASPA|nr:hypothetical protein AXF42_Ash017830 [Apostasia shenzhenica]